MNWSDDVIARTIKLWNDGASAGEICQRLNIKSRSAVIGKIHRLRKNGDQRIVRAAEKNQKPEFSEEEEKERDQESLHILQRREWDAATYSTIGNELCTTGRTIAARYNRILKALAESEAT